MGTKRGLPAAGGGGTRRTILDFHNFEFIQPDGRYNFAEGMNNSFRYIVGEEGKATGPLCGEVFGTVMLPSEISPAGAVPEA